MSLRKTPVEKHVENINRWLQDEEIFMVSKDSETEVEFPITNLEYDSFRECIIAYTIGNEK